MIWGSGRSDRGQGSREGVPVRSHRADAGNGAWSSEPDAREFARGRATPRSLRVVRIVRGGDKTGDGRRDEMSAPESATSARQVVPLELDGPKQVGWHDHHGMELTHVREFEPRCARVPRAPSPLRTPTLTVSGPSQRLPSPDVPARSPSIPTRSAVNPATRTTNPYEGGGAGTSVA